MRNSPTVQPYRDRWGRPVRRRGRWTHVSHQWNGPVWRLDRSDWDLEFDEFDHYWYLWYGGSQRGPIGRYLDGAMEWCEHRYYEMARNWHLDMSARFPELEIHLGNGWGLAEELADVELGDRVTLHEALWLPTRFYSKERDRVWAAVAGMFGMVVERVRRDRSEGEKILRVLAGDDPQYVSLDEMPPGWVPAVAKENS